MGKILSLGGGDGGQQKPPEGLKVCPFMSPAWFEKNPGVIQGGQQQVSANIIAAPCMGEKCGVWSETRERCSLRSELAVLKKVEGDKPSSA